MFLKSIHLAICTIIAIIYSVIRELWKVTCPLTGLQVRGSLSVMFTMKFIPKHRLDINEFIATMVQKTLYRVVHIRTKFDRMYIK